MTQQTKSVALPSGSTIGQPTLLGAAGRRQWRIVVRNLGPLTVWLGSRDDLDAPSTGFPLLMGETFTHDGTDPLYCQLETVAATVPTIVTTLQVQQFSSDGDALQPIAGDAFPWPTGPDWGQSQ